MAQCAWIGLGDCALLSVLLCLGLIQAFRHLNRMDNELGRYKSSSSVQKGRQPVRFIEGRPPVWFVTTDLLQLWQQHAVKFWGHTKIQTLLRFQTSQLEKKSQRKKERKKKPHSATGMEPDKKVNCTFRAVLTRYLLKGPCPIWKYKVQLSWLFNDWLV